MTITVLDALAGPGPLIAAWDEGRTKEPWLGVYLVAGPGRPKLLAHENVPAGERESRTAALRASGVRIGSVAGHGPAVWSIADDFRIWHEGGLVVATKDAVRIGDRSIVPDRIAGVATFVEDERSHRGVRLALRDGTSIVLTDERDAAAEMDPTYGWDNLAIDAFWASLLGRHLAEWLQVPHQDDIF